MPERAVIIVPTRIGSTRLPQKALLDETGKTLTQHVAEAAARATVCDRVVVACDDERIERAVASYGGESVMTGEHANGTSRLAEATTILGLDDETIVVNVQGDEPEIDASIIDDAVRLLESTDAEITTVASPFGQGEDPMSPSIVKAVLTQDGRALYFSRSLVPFDRDGVGASPPLKHIGIYVYRKRTLDRYAALPGCPLEEAERLEQLRALDAGMTIRAVVRETQSHGIDTREDYESFVARQKNVR